MALLNHLIIKCLIWGESYHIVFHSGCTILRCHQQYMRVPISSSSLTFVIFQGFCFCFALIIVFLMEMKWHLIMVLICISIVTSGVDYLFHALNGHLFICFKRYVYSSPLLFFLQFYFCWSIDFIFNHIVLSLAVTYIF